MDIVNKTIEYFISTQKLDLFRLDNNYSEEYWGNISDLNIILNLIKPLSLMYKENYKFIDIGCGSFNILFLAKLIGYNITGIDIQNFYYSYKEITSKYFKELNNDVNFINDDINNIDLEFYNEFDIIYSYRPLKNDFRNFVNKLIDVLNSDKIIILPEYNYDEYFNLDEDIRLEKIGEFIYKIKK